MKRINLFGLGLGVMMLALTTSCTKPLTAADFDSSKLAHYTANGSIKVDENGLRLEGKDSEGNTAALQTKIDSKGSANSAASTSSTNIFGGNFEVKGPIVATITNQADRNGTEGERSNAVCSTFNLIAKDLSNGKGINSTFNFDQTISNGGELTKGSGHVASEDRQIPAFSKLESDGSIQIRFNAGGDRALSVEADDNLLPLIKTTVNGDTLRVWSDKAYSTNQPIVVSISNNQLNRIACNGSGDCRIENLQEKELQVIISGSADMVASGEAKSLELDISGSGKFAGEKLHVINAKIDLVGSGEAAVNVADQIDATVSGSGSVRYRGTPEVNSAVTGSGEVTPLPQS